MPPRKVMLRLMLWFLGLAAFTGILTVFFQRGTVLWRILGTELCAAFACALLLPCIVMIDRERTRTAGLLGMIGVMVEFFLSLALIWELPRVLLGMREDEFGATAFVLGLAVLVSMPLLTLARDPAHAAAAKSGIAVVLLAAVAFLVAIWIPQRAAQEEKWAFTGVAVITTGALQVICLLGLGEARRRHWRWTGIAAAFAAFLMWLHDIWVKSGSDLGFAIFTGLLALSAVVAYAIVVGYCPLRQGQIWFRTATIISAAITAMLIELYIIQDRHLIRSLEEFWIGRFTAASGIVTACGTIALAVLERLNRRVEWEPGSSSMTEIAVICPRCRKMQSLPIGDATCVQCRLRISVRVEEPRCPICDYLLIGLTSDLCPECGTRI